MIDYEIEVVTVDGIVETLEQYRGKVMMIVNTASECGFTSQYEALQELWSSYGDAGLVVLAFPCNQFGGQEPSSNENIAQFCREEFDVSFPVYAKIDVNGESAHPLFQYLKRVAPGALGTETIKWNFTKFLVGRDGEVLNRYAPATPPSWLGRDIEAALATSVRAA